MQINMVIHINANYFRIPLTGDDTTYTEGHNKTVI